MTKILFKTLLVSVAAVLLFASCENNMLESNNTNITPSSHSLRSVPVNLFDWETVDWMPTPPGQTQIPPPWIGQGSLASTYGIDVINDRKAADGWVLLYSTFSYTGPNLKVPIRFTIKVTPNDGSPASTIIKTFYLNVGFNSDNPLDLV